MSSVTDSLPTSTDVGALLPRATLRGVSRRLIPFLFLLYIDGSSGNFRSGLLLLAFVPLMGMVLALRLRHAPVLRDVT